MRTVQRAAPWHRAVLAQVRAELALTVRRGESVLVTIAIPVVLLVFFSLVDVLPVPEGVTDAVGFLAPGILALAIMSSAMVSLGIATGFERQYGVLKRLGTTPARPAGPCWRPRRLAVVVVEVVQVAVLVARGPRCSGWDPAGGAAGVAAAVAAGAARHGRLRRARPW